MNTSSIINYNNERYYKNEKDYYRTTRKSSARMKLLHKEIFSNETGVIIADSECVHHIDGNPLNNNLNNLMLMSQANHTKHHNWLRRGRKSIIDSRCAVDGCDKPHLSKGFCRVHYNENREAADCSVGYCKRISWAKGLCGTHHADMIRQSRESCSIQGCEGQIRSVSLKLCKPHYDFYRKHKNAKAG